MTTLHWAVQEGHVDVCRFLLSNGADPSLLTVQGLSVYELSTTDAVQLVLKNEPAVTSDEIELQLLEAAKNSDLEAIKVLSYYIVCTFTHFFSSL